jgi:methylase of polypeptide subunit release factors
MAGVFLEVLVDSKEALANGIESRDEIEDPLSESLEAAGIGEVSGGGSGSGSYIIDLDIAGEDVLPKALEVIRRTLRELRVPTNTRIRRGRPQEEVFPVYD